MAPSAIDSAGGGLRRPTHPFLALSVIALAIMIVVVLVTRTGVDVLIIVALLAGLFVVERFLSDWFNDVLGPKLGLGLLAALLIGFGLWGTSKQAPKPVQAFVSSPLSSLVGYAEGYGYNGAFVSGARPVLAPAASSVASRVATRLAPGGPVSDSTVRPSTGSGSEASGSTPADPVTPMIELSVEPAAPLAGAPARIVVVVTSEGGPVGGEVAVDVNRIESGRLQLTGGTAAWTTVFPNGRFRLQARYIGAGRFASARSAPVTVELRAR
jgi:hypothetical protein